MEIEPAAHVACSVNVGLLWVSVIDDGLTLRQHWVELFCFNNLVIIAVI